jgi:hypothetical protein
MPHLFEFMDLAWLPRGLRTTLREILDRGNSWPFRAYYRWAASQIRGILARGEFVRVVELGAGTAPLTRSLACTIAADDPLELVVCDINPDLAAYDRLVERYGNRIRTLRSPVDFSQPRQWEPRTLLCLSATLHHIPAQARAQVLATLVDSADGVVIFEPLRKTRLSILFAFGSLVPSLLLPATKLFQAGSLRRIFWCWLFPIAPLLFVWDGVISCVREWTVAEWEAACADGPLAEATTVSLRESTFCQAVELRRAETFPTEDEPNPQAAAMSG